MLAKIMIWSLVVVLLVVILGSAAHRWQLWRTEGQTTPLGSAVSVGAYDLQLLQRGEGSRTVVFLAGSGTSSPILDFKPLWQPLAERFGVAVIERAGYGFSPVVPNLDRSSASLMDDSRRVLLAAGIHPPYDLVVHSMGMLEAMEWLRHYPDDIGSVTAIDPAVPQAYKVMQIPTDGVLRIMSWLSAAGMTRILPSARALPNILGDPTLYSDEERALYRQRIHTRTLTANMLAEVRSVRSSAAALEDFVWPTDIPLLVFSSPGNEVGVENWQEYLNEFAVRANAVDFVALPGSHYLHHQHSVEIVAGIVTLLSE